MFYQSSLLLVMWWFLFFVFCLRWTRSKKSPVDRPPAVPGLPVFGNLHQLGSLPHRSLRALAEKHGPVMALRLGRVPTVVVSSPAGAQEVLKTRDLAFANRPDSSLADRIFYSSQDLAFSKYGEPWRQMRRIGVLHLLNQKQVHSFRKVREEEADALVARIRSAAGCPVNLSDMIIDFTSDLICRVALGQTYADSKGGGSQLRALFGEFMELMGQFPVRDYIPWLAWVDWLSGLDDRARKIGLEIDALLEKVIDEHRRSKLTDKIDTNDMDLVDVLLSLGDRNDDDAPSSTNISLTMDNIKGLILDMVAAGTASTKATLEWAMAELIRHPEEMAKVQEEIRRVAGPKGEEIREEALEGMGQLKAVLKETLRLHPPGPLLLPRESTESTELQGYCIPKGTRVIVNGWAIARDPALWDKAEEFLPERFLGDSGAGALDFKGSDFRYLPFGGGRRGCPGSGFAIAAVEVVLASLLYHFDWEMPGGLSAEEMDMDEVFGLIIQKKSSVILQGRTKPHF
ncbi:cytochrome P450 71A1-like [Zingiber officinale]|uniref:cytochrome P450 71A1-like n=1 Tax=Zingiber officinale TaxID=94328 RepID=UPI001C4B8E4B|nr:cytochrome P450 71A1-like [Zingiber officinale]